jgi:hypothetical protein
MCYSRKSEKRQYETPPPPSTAGKGQPGFKGKADFEKDLISKSTEAALKANQPKESSSESPK